MAKQTFTTGQVLTAAQMTSLQQTAMGGGSPSTKTASYVLVAADAGTVIQMNSASATTITVNTALFAAGDSVQIQNIGAGVCTVTAGTATVTTAGSLDLSQWENGFLYFTSTSASIFFDVVQSSTVIPTSYGYTAGKNVLINGGFDIWQRGTSSSGNAYICDRWYSALISGTGTFAQESTTVPTGATYSMKFTASATAQPGIYQAVESLNATRYAGQTMTVSGLVAASTSTGFTIDVQYSTSTDNSVTGTWTSITASSGGTATATSTTFVSISGVYVVPSTAKSLRVRVFTTSTIANTVVVYFGNTQLEAGLSATTFAKATGNQASELSACQRYARAYTVSGMIPNLGYYETNTVGVSIITFSEMRVSPSLTATSGTNYYTFKTSGGGSDNVNSLTLGGASIVSVTLFNSTEALGTGGQAGQLIINSGGSIILSSEL
jgi:hypothetical protein